MIFTQIINWVSGALNIIISLLPNADSGIISTITTYNTQFRSALVNINWFFPVDTALTFLGIVFVIQGIILSFKIIKYVAGVLTAGILK